MLVPHGAYILMVDGGRMHLFRNHGRDSAIELETRQERELHNPRTHVTNEPQPGRSFQSMGFERSAYEGTDTHQRREDAFCEEALDEALGAAAEADELILIAPAHVMGVLRKHLEHHHKHPPVREIVKDLTAFSPSELTGWLRSHH